MADPEKFYRSGGHDKYEERNEAPRRKRTGYLKDLNKNAGKHKIVPLI